MCGLEGGGCEEFSVLINKQKKLLLSLLVCLEAPAALHGWSRASGLWLGWKMNLHGVFLSCVDNLIDVHDTGNLSASACSPWSRDRSSLVSE